MENKIANGVLLAVVVIFIIVLLLGFYNGMELNEEKIFFQSNGIKCEIIIPENDNDARIWLCDGKPAWLSMNGKEIPSYLEMNKN